MLSIRLVLFAALVLADSAARAWEVWVSPNFGPTIPAATSYSVHYHYLFSVASNVGAKCPSGQFFSFVDGWTYEATVTNSVPQTAREHHDGYGFEDSGDACTCSKQYYEVSSSWSQVNDGDLVYTPCLGYWYQTDAYCQLSSSCVVNDCLYGICFADTNSPPCANIINETHQGTDQNGNVIWKISYSHLAGACYQFDVATCDCGNNVKAHPIAYGSSAYYELDITINQGVSIPTLASLGIPIKPPSWGGTGGLPDQPLPVPPGPIPQPPPSGSGPLGFLVSSGGYHELAAEADGTVRAWGANNYGQLGNGTFNSSSTPVQVSGLSIVNLVSAGYFHSLALLTNGTVWAWGMNYYGELGNGSGGGQGPPGGVSSPVLVGGVRSTLTGVTNVSAGAYSSYAVKTNGSVWAWGYNSNGQLGDQSTVNRLLPVAVANVTGAIMVAGGWSHALALDRNGHVWSWGNNSNGQLGIGTSGGNQSTPQQIPNLNNIVAIGAGGFSSYAIDNTGAIWAWGANASGQLGNGYSTDSSVPVSVSGFGSTGQVAIGISGGQSYCLALALNGSTWAWGDNSYGQLGNGNQGQSIPVPVVFPDSSIALGIAAGYQQSLSIQTDGTLRSWGSNSNGQLGNGTVGGTQSTPGPVSNFP